MEPDERLIERLRGGDLAAFDRLYERYEGPLYGFIRTYVTDGAEAEDVFHEAFMQVLRNKDLDLSRFRAWLYTTSRNLCLNRLRSRKRGAEARRRILEIVPEGPSDPEKQLVDARAKEALGAAVGQLPQTLSEVFHLRASGMSYEEMAAVLELPLGTVKSRMHEMVQQLRKDMSSWTAR
jgi:RNA polymerase sigma-70 factor (ECF subfamily)